MRSSLTDFSFTLFEQREGRVDRDLIALRCDVVLRFRLREVHARRLDPATTLRREGSSRAPLSAAWSAAAAEAQQFRGSNDGGAADGASSSEGDGSSNQTPTTTTTTSSSTSGDSRWLWTSRLRCAKLEVVDEQARARADRYDALDHGDGAGVLDARLLRMLGVNSDGRSVLLASMRSAPLTGFMLASPSTLPPIERRDALLEGPPVPPRKALQRVGDAAQRTQEGRPSLSLSCAPVELVYSSNCLRGAYALFCRADEQATILSDDRLITAAERCKKEQQQSQTKTPTKTNVKKTLLRGTTPRTAARQRRSKLRSPLGGRVSGVFPSISSSARARVTASRPTSLGIDIEASVASIALVVPVPRHTNLEPAVAASRLGRLDLLSHPSRDALTVHAEKLCFIMRQGRAPYSSSSSSSSSCGDANSAGLSAVSSTLRLFEECEASVATLAIDVADTALLRTQANDEVTVDSGSASSAASATAARETSGASVALRFWEPMVLPSFAVIVSPSVSTPRPPELLHRTRPSTLEVVLPRLHVTVTPRSVRALTALLDKTERPDAEDVAKVISLAAAMRRQQVVAAAALAALFDERETMRGCSRARFKARARCGAVRLVLQGEAAESGADPLPDRGGKALLEFTATAAVATATVATAGEFLF